MYVYIYVEAFLYKDYSSADWTLVAIYEAKNCMWAER